MNCPSCNKNNADPGKFCIFCGSEIYLESANTERPRELSLDTQSLYYLYDQIISLRSDLRAIQEQIIRLGTSPSANQPVEQLSHRDTINQSELESPSVAANVNANVDVPKLSSKLASINWEPILGGNWLVRIGVLAVIIGAAFFLKLSFDNAWIDERGRVILGIITGFLMLAGGEYWHKRYRVYAHAITGGGVGLTYLTFFGAFALYNLIPFYPAVILLFIVSATSTMLALRHNAMSLAILGIFGAFLAPFIIGTSGSDNQFFDDPSKSLQLIGYVIIVDIGVLVLSTFKNWRWFTLLALIGSQISFVAWWLEYGDENLAKLTSQAILTVIFLIFVASTMLFHVLWRRKPNISDYSLILLNALGYLTLSYEVLWDVYGQWMGLFTFLLSLFYCAIGILLLRRRPAQLYTSLMALGVSIILFAAAIPIQFDGPSVSAIWATESAVLIWLSFRLQMWQMRLYGAGMFTISTIWLITTDTPTALSLDLTPVANEFFPTYILAIVTTYFSGFILYKNSDNDNYHNFNQLLAPIFLTVANVFVALTIVVQFDGKWITVLWSIEAITLLALSLRLGLQELRFFAWAMMVMVIFRLFNFDTSVNLENYLSVVNGRMLAFLAAVIASYISVYSINKYGVEIPTRERTIARLVLLVTANFLTLWVLSNEILDAVDSGNVSISEDSAWHVKSLSLNLLWAVYASIILVLGIIKKIPFVRIGGLVILAVPIIKLFTFDAYSLDQGYRVAAFLSLGIMLLSGGFLYQRFGNLIRGFIFEEKEAPV